MTSNGRLDPSIQSVLDYASELHPRRQMNPIDLLPGGKYQLPGGFLVTLDTFNEKTWLFGPYGDEGISIKTLAAYGEFKILGEDLVRALTHVLQLGEPFGKRTTSDERHQYFLKLLASAVPFPVPAAPPMTLADMERHVAVCDKCRPVNVAFIGAINAGASIATEQHLRTMIDKAHADPEAAAKFYWAKARSHGHSPRAAVTTAQEV